MAPEKTMSSRLLTMKFMQRAAANPPIPSNHNSLHPTKRPRLSHGTSPSHSTRRDDDPPTSSPSAYTKDNSAYVSALRHAEAVEKKKLEEANERYAREVGETRWVLDVRPVEAKRPRGTVVVGGVGWGDIDEGQDSGEDSGEGGGRVNVGRMSFGQQFLKKRQVTSADDEGEGEDGSESTGSSAGSHEDDDSELSGLSQMIRESKAKATAAVRQANTGESHKRKSQVEDGEDDRPSKIRSLSGRKVPDIICHQCGQTGHLRSQCPQRSEIICHLCGQTGHIRSQCRRGK